VSPIDTLYDINGDRFVDVRVIWQDQGGRVNPSSARLRSLHALNGPADTATNLILAWHLVRLDDSGLLLREDLANLLPGGSNRLELSVEDTSGNRRVDTLTFVLPTGVLLDSIPTGVSSPTDNIMDIAIDRDGRYVVTTPSHFVQTASWSSSAETW
jgi:hypothetical protein